MHDANAKHFITTTYYLQCIKNDQKMLLKSHVTDFKIILRK